MHWFIFLLLFGPPPDTANKAADKSGPAPAAAAAASAPVNVGLTRAASLRNENVQANRIDNDALKLSNVRLGDNVSIIPQPPVEASYYATEHGRPAGEPPAARPPAAVQSWHGELFEYHQNSVFNARTFFQVGPVEPSHRNSYGARFSGPVRGLGGLSGSFSQRKVRGMVNGNVLVPLESERTPLATDPAVRAVVERFLAAYPDVLPNRPDFDPRALNTNAPQNIDEIDGTLRLDRQTGAKSRLFASHTINRQRVDAFQLVAGQNPDTDIHTQRSRLSWQYTPSAETEIIAGGGFTRLTSYLRSEPNAVGPRVRMGYQIEELGPDSQFPIDRALNSFRWGGVLSHRTGGGRHRLTAGADMTRYQLNGIETNNARGLFWFSNNFGRTAIENLRMGVPTTYEVTVGPMDRGFRNWGADLFTADQWTVNSRLQIYFGVRYNLVTAPGEVNHLNDIPYACDCNNFAPRFSIAWRGPGEWVVRAGYTVSFGDIPPVTYQQVRYNLPLARYIQVQSPDLLDPLRGIDLNDPQGRSSPTILSPDLVSPYAHQYSLLTERRLAQNYVLRLGYVGSRTFKLLDVYMQNRAVPVPGLPLTTVNVDERRPDPRYYDVKHIVNAGAAYMDAAQAGFQGSWRRGITWGATYTFGKAIDSGADYSATAANNDMSKGRAQMQYGAQGDRKGLSNFDSTHSFLAYYSWDLPKTATLRWATEGWELSGSMLAKTGTPLTLYVGSDAPGFGNVDGGPGDRPNILDPSILGMTVGNPDTAPSILRRDRFSYVVPGDVRGNLGRGTLRKGGIVNLNAAVSKQWRWGMERAVEFRAEAFNLTNTPQFDEPQRNLTSPAFGKITNTLNDGRVLQMGVRFIL